MKKLLFLLLITLSIALPVQAETITLKNTNKDSVYRYILNSYSTYEYTVLKKDKNNIVSKYNGSSEYFSDLWGKDAYLQYAFNISQFGKDVIVKYDTPVVSGNQIHSLSKEAISYYPLHRKRFAERSLYYNIDYLLFLKGVYNGKHYFGFQRHREKGENSIYLTKIYPGFPAEKAGLKVGDEIIKVNGKYCNSLRSYALNTLFISASLYNQPLNLQVRRGEDILDFTLQPFFISIEELKKVPVHMSKDEFLSTYRKDVTQ